MVHENHSTGTPLLEIRDLSLGFRERKNRIARGGTRSLAVDRVSFSLNAGSILGLIGSSGAGKSSIARAILRLAPAHSGEIMFKGDDVLKMDARQLNRVRRGVQLVFQNPSASLSPRRTIGQSLLEPLEHFALGDSELRAGKVATILQTVGLDHDVLQRFPHQFSSGQQQRIAIARALVTDPDLLIADEAVAALDVSVQAQILQLIRSLQKRRDIAFLFISHDLAVIRQIADHVAVMYRGQLLEHSSADRFFTSPAHPYSRTLLEFAKSRPGTLGKGGQLRLKSRNDSDRHGSVCIYSHDCTETLPVCHDTEPPMQTLDIKKQNTDDRHCVKCHLYDPGKIS